MARKRPRVTKKPAKLARPSKVFAEASADAADASFAIMLDDLLRIHPFHFPISAQDRTIDPLRAVSQHNGFFVLVPRSAWAAMLRENKDLIDARDGGIDEGGIYEMNRRAEPLS